MWSKLGVFALVGGFLIGVFSGISSFTGRDSFFKNLTISELTGDFSQTLVEAIPAQAVQDLIYSLVYEISLGWILAGFSVLCFLIGAVVKEH